MEAATAATRRDPTGGETARAAEEIPAGWKPADPGPLGLAAFALTTFILSMYNSGILHKVGEPVVLGSALMYGGIAQILAGMWEFRTGNTFGAVAFTSYGAFWLSLWALNVFYAKAIPAAVVAQSVGVFLVAWSIFTTYMTIAALRTSGAVAIVFVLLCVTFWLLAIGNWTTTTSVVKAGGYVGLATALAAWYASFAAVANATFGRTILPTKPLT